MQSISQKVPRREEDKIPRIVDRVLRQVFGNEATHLIYRFLEKNYALKQDEITQKIDVFAKGLEEFLNSGACVIEQKILEDIYSSYGLLRRLELQRTHVSNDFVGQIRLLAHRA